MTTMHWGRKGTIIFPPHNAIYTYGAVFFAVILTGLFVYLRFTFGNTPLQRFYTPIYIRSSVAAGVSASRKDKYCLVMIGARDRERNRSRLRSRSPPCTPAMVCSTRTRNGPTSMRP
jgi:hypothetical protein